MGPWTMNKAKTLITEQVWMGEDDNRRHAADISVDTNGIVEIRLTEKGLTHPVIYRSTLDRLAVSLMYSGFLWERIRDILR